MRQAIKLDGIAAEGDASAQKNLQVHFAIVCSDYFHAQMIIFSSFCPLMPYGNPQPAFQLGNYDGICGATKLLIPSTYTM